MEPSTVGRKLAWCRIGAVVSILLLGAGVFVVIRLMPARPVVEPAPSPVSEPAVVCDVRLEDLTEQTGITFEHTDGSSGRKYIVETVTAGLALLDYDGDGLIDVYFVNGAPLSPATAERPPANALYRNEGDMRFRDVTDEAGVGDTGFGLGVAAGDYDNDGDLDLYVNNFGPNVLYRNDGDGTFTDVTEVAGVACGNKVGAGACFFDADGDGRLDLYVANYVDFRYDTHFIRTTDGFPCYPGPMEFDPVPDVLYHNNGDGTFTDVSEEAGVSRVAGTGMGVVCADYDNDRDTDVFVLNDVSGNFLFVNDGSGKFAEAGVLRGLAYNFEGQALGSMGVDCADYDNDGWLDFFMTSYSQELPVLYRNLADGFFEDVTLTSGAGTGSLPHVNWGTGFADFDHDGDRDLFIACGHLQENIKRWDPSTSYRVPNLLLMNTGDGKFVNVSDRCGDGFAAVQSSRGLGLDDLDNDGDVDVVILNSRSGPTILRNDTRNDNHWVQIRLKGTRANRDGIGAQVRVTAGDLTRLDEVHSGRGYQSHHGLRLHFGLGTCERVDRIEVRWIGGGVDVVEDLPADRLVTIVEGKGLAGE